MPSLLNKQLHDDMISRQRLIRNIVLTPECRDALLFPRSSGPARRDPHALCGRHAALGPLVEEADEVHLASEKLPIFGGSAERPVARPSVLGVSA